jgi:hypothetical protein
MNKLNVMFAVAFLGSSSVLAILVPENPDTNLFVTPVGTGTVESTLLWILDILLTLVGLVSTIYVVIGGYYYVTARGNEERATKGKQTIINAVIGLTAAVLAFAILYIVENAARGAL